MTDQRPTSGKRVSTYCLRAGVIAALAGMSLGLAMGVSGDFRLASAHAHLNLLGWVSMFLYGLYYRGADLGRWGRWATIHAGVATLGLVVFVPSLGLVMAGPPALAGLAESGLKAGSSLIILGMMIFTGLVFLSSSPHDDRAEGQAIASTTPSVDPV